MFLILEHDTLLHGERTVKRGCTVNSINLYTWHQYPFSCSLDCDLSFQLHVRLALPSLVLKARRTVPRVTAFCTGLSRLEVPEQALDGILLDLGLVYIVRRKVLFHLCCFMSYMT